MAKTIARKEIKEENNILNDFLNSKICIWYKDSDEKIIGLLKRIDPLHLLIFDEKTKMEILVKRADYFKIEKWKGGRFNE